MMLGSFEDYGLYSELHSHAHELDTKANQILVVNSAGLH